MEQITKIPTKIKLNKLMSLMLHFFTRSYDLFKKVKSEEFKVTIHYKQKNEKFTEADWILQKVFENYMNKYFPSIKIIGEEDTSDNLIQKSEFFELSEKINFDMIQESQIPESLREIPDEELAMYIDPIDSTEQFIKRNFGPVTSLVGITRNSEAFLGFIYFPYFDGMDNMSLVYFNIPGKGIFCYDTQKETIEPVPVNKVEDNNWTFVSSGSRTNETMRHLFSLFPNGKSRAVHGLGGKAYECVVKDNVFLASGSDLGLWDVCAGHALNKEVGGGLYYLDGKEVDYPRNDTARRLNGFTFMTNNDTRIKTFVDVYSKSGIKLE